MICATTRFFRLPKVDSTVYKGLDEFQCCGSWDYTDADVFLDDEMVLYRVNKVPDESYVHFLNFIGEERRTAIPSCVALTYNWSDRYQRQMSPTN